MPSGTALWFSVTLTSASTGTLALVMASPPL
jgi:hypothetical protein